jgi:predicted DCC family thiol-disulfide oxidoreductase YuxK
MLADTVRILARPSLRTTPPARPVVLYDGHCRFCTATMKKLSALVPAGAVEELSFQEPGVLERFPGVTHEACMKELKLVATSGRVYGGVQAVVHTLALRPAGALAYGYYVPGIRLLLDGIYAAIAANRYRIMGKQVAAGECTESCALHLRK